MSNTDKIAIELTPLEFADLEELVELWYIHTRSRTITSGFGTDTRKVWEERAEKAKHLKELLTLQPGSDEEN